MPLRIVPLEPRIVLDAALAVDAAAAAAESYEGDGDPTETPLEGEGSEHEALVTLQEVAAEEVYETLPVERQGLHLLVVSSQVQDYLQLGDAARDDVEVVYYDASEATLQTIIDLIADTLQDRQADTIAFANEGIEGQMMLTDEVTLSLESLAENTGLLGFWRTIGDFIHEDGRIDLLACRITAIPAGDTLITAIETVTERNVAASDDDTANSKNGGDWVLESDGIDVQGLYFDSEAIADWNGIPPTWSW